MNKVNVVSRNVVTSNTDSRSVRTLATRTALAGLSGAVLLAGVAGCDQTGTATGQRNTETVANTTDQNDQNRQQTDAAVTTLFDAGTSPASFLPGQRFPYQWHYPQAQHIQHMEGKPAPELRLTDWHGDENKINALASGEKITVVTFWASWSQLSVMALGNTVELADQYRDDVDFLAVHDATRGAEKMVSLAEENGVNYPVALDADGASARNWNVNTWPTIFILDRNGIVRGAGMRAEYIEDAVQTLLEQDQAGDTVAAANEPWVSPNADQYTPETAPAPQPTPAYWEEDNPGAEALIDRQLGYGTPPMIQSQTWVNAENLTLNHLRGKVVMLRFWGTWCPHCLRSMDQFNALHDKYYDQGLVIIGVTDERNVSLMGGLANQHNVPYPMCADDGGYMKRAYHLDQFPDYYFIDRWGRLRVVDCKNGHLEDAIQMLLNERPQ